MPDGWSQTRLEVESKIQTLLDDEDNTQDVKTATTRNFFLGHMRMCVF